MPRSYPLQQCHFLAPAKINLGLRVLDRRPDGYHNISTVFQSIGLADDVTVSFWRGEPRSLQFWCDRPDLDNTGNLAWQAADMALHRLRIRARVRVHVRKEIPAGAGLGGGSSDAAAVLLAFESAILGKRVRRSEIRDIACELGSDVPYFLTGGTASGTGRGTVVVPFPDLPRKPVVLVLPDIEVSTAWAYQALAEGRREGLTQPAPESRMGGFGGSPVPFQFGDRDIRPGSLLNDFEGVVFQRFPVLGELKRKLLALGARNGLLSGTGSTVFGLFDSDEQAAEAAEAVATDGLRVEVTEIVSRTDLGMQLAMDEDAGGPA